MFADVCSGFVIRLPLRVCRLYVSRPLASALRAGQDLRVDQTLADAPVVVQQVAEVGDVQTDLAGVPAAAELAQTDPG